MPTRRAVPARSARVVAASCAAAFAFAAVLTACADKEFTPPSSAFSPRIELQLTTTASQVAGFGPKYVELLVVYARRPESQTNDDSIRLLAEKSVDFTLGSQTVTVPIDLALCMADPNRSGPKDGCLIYVAGVLTDKHFAADSEGSIFDAFDVKLFGPFEVAPGRVPTIPPMDLSATRFGVIRWEGDDALRLGGPGTPNFLTGPVTGVASGTGTPILFAPTVGFDFTSTSITSAYLQLAILQNGAWRRVSATTAPAFTNTFQSAYFVDITALSASEVYLAHGTAGLFKFDGTAIAKVSAISDSVFSLASVTTSTGAKHVIAGGGAGNVWIGDTQTWQRLPIPGATQRIDGVCITGPSEAFAASSVGGGGLWRFDGSKWTSVAPTSGSKYGLQCPAPGQAFVLGPSVWKWNGSAFAQLPFTGVRGGPSQNFAWGVVSGTEIYAASDSAGVDRAFYRFNGTSWTEVGRKRVTQGPAFVQGLRLWADPRGGAAYYAAAFGRVERVTATTATVLSYQAVPRDISMSSPTNAFAVGANSFLARWNGVSWTVDAPPAGLQMRILHGVWSDGPNNAWAAGQGSTILRYNGSAWSVVSDTAKPVASADAYNAVWGTGSDVWVAGNTMVHCKSPTSCANEATGGVGALYGLWGSSNTNVLAVGAGGRIVRYNGTSWSAMASPTTRTLVRVAGSGPSDIWAVGDSVLVHFDGTAWTNVPMTGDLKYMRSVAPYPQLSLFQIGLWVRGPNEAYLGADFGGIARWDGTAWNQMGSGRDFRRRVVGIAGAGGCAFAITDGAGESPAPALWRGVGPTGCFSTPMTGPATWP